MKSRLCSAPILLMFVCGLILTAILPSGPASADNATKTVSSEYPFLSSGPLAAARIVTLPKGVILRSGELKLTQKELDAEIRKSPEEVRPKLKRNLFYVLENLTVDSLIAWEAQAWAKDNKGTYKDENSLFNAYLDDLTKTASVTDEELKSFFEKNKDTIGDATFEQVKDQMKDYLLSEKRGDMVDAHVYGLSKKYEIDVDKDWVAKQNKAAMDNVVDKARKSGKPSLVDFGSDKCKPCEMMAPILESLKKEYAGKLNVVFVHVQKEQVLADRYKVGAIPVQVFYDKNGKEVFRHVGFFSEEQIKAKLAEMGVK